MGCDRASLALSLAEEAGVGWTVSCGFSFFFFFFITLGLEMSDTNVYEP